MTTPRLRPTHLTAPSMDDAIVQLLGSGLALSEIADRLEMLPTELEIHMTVFMRRMGARTLPHLVALHMGRSHGES